MVMGVLGMVGDSATVCYTGGEADGQTGGVAGLASDGDQTAMTLRDGWTCGIGLYPSPYIVLPVPWTWVP